MLNDLINRSCPPTPWTEGDNIPWDDPDFSNRMLAEHLSQDHDLASRRSTIVDRQVAAISADLPGQATVLDLACGPGLYLNRFAAAGHRGVGIDFGPASIEHARSEAPSDLVEYRLEDLRTAGFGSGFDLVLLLYGQLNVFRRSEAASLLERAYAALRPVGRIILEPQTYAHVAQSGQETPSWTTHEKGLFAAEAHVLLTESFWVPPTTTQRFWVITARSVVRHAMSTEAYTAAELTRLLETAGFGQVIHRDELAGDTGQDSLSVVTALRRA